MGGTPIFSHFSPILAIPKIFTSVKCFDLSGGQKKGSRKGSRKGSINGSREGSRKGSRKGSIKPRGVKVIVFLKEIWGLVRDCTHIMLSLFGPF